MKTKIIAVDGVNAPALKWYPDPFLTLAEFYCVSRTHFNNSVDAAKEAYRLFFGSNGTYDIEQWLEEETHRVEILRWADPQNWRIDLVKWAGNGMLENLAEVREMIWGCASYDPTDDESFESKVNNAHRLRHLKSLTSWKLCAGCNQELTDHLKELDPEELTDQEQQQLEFEFMRQTTV